MAKMIMIRVLLAIAMATAAIVMVLSYRTTCWELGEAKGCTIRYDGVRR